MKLKTTTKIAGINETKHIFFEKIDNKCLARISKEKGRKHRLSISEMEERLSLETPQTLKG